MLKYIKNSNIRVKKFGAMVGIIPIFSSNTDDIDKIGKKENKLPDTDGWTRLKKMFQIDEFGEISNEMNAVVQTAMLSSFIGFLYGGVNASKVAYTNFMRNNTASTFKSHYEAKKKLQDAVAVNFAKGGWKWSWRLCVFSTSFVGLSTMISVYRGKNGIIEYVLAGSCAGIMYKWQMGPRGWIVGSGLGAVLGLTSGTITYGLLKLTGISMDELRGYQKELGQMREKKITENMKEYMKEEDALLRMHNEKVSKVTSNT